MKIASMTAAALLTACLAASQVHAADIKYADYLGSWDGTWRSSNTGESGNVSVSCRRGSSLGPNCTATVTLLDGSDRRLPISPEVQNDGSLRWKNGPLDYKFSLRDGGSSMRVTYKVTKDRGVWNMARR